MLVPCLCYRPQAGSFGPSPRRAPRDHRRDGNVNVAERSRPCHVHVNAHSLLRLPKTCALTLLAIEYSPCVRSWMLALVAVVAGATVGARADAPPPAWTLHVFTTGRDRLTPSALGGFVAGWAPVHAFVLAHPEHGLVVFDTGLNHQVATRRTYGSCWSHVVADYDLRRGEDLPTQMRRAGLDPAAVRLVVLSHLHSDHAGEVEAFPGAQVLLGRDDMAWGEAQGELRSVHAHEIDNAKLRPIEVTTGPPLGPFAHAQPLELDGALAVLAVPGHSPGSIALLARLPGGPVLLAGDALASARFARWVEGGHPVGSVAADPAAARATILRIRALEAAEPELRVIGGHEPDLPYHRSDVVIHAFTGGDAEDRPDSAWDERRSGLFTMPAVLSVGRSGVSPAVAGGLGTDVLPCLAIDAGAVVAMPFGGRGAGVTFLALRYSIEFGGGLAGFVSVGPSVAFVETPERGAFELESALMTGAGLIWTLGPALALRLDVGTASVFTPGDLAWPPFQLRFGGIGLVTRL